LVLLELLLLRVKVEGKGGALRVLETSRAKHLSRERKPREAPKPTRKGSGFIAEPSLVHKKNLKQKGESGKCVGVAREDNPLTNQEKGEEKNRGQTVREKG